MLQNSLLMLDSAILRHYVKWNAGGPNLIDAKVGYRNTRGGVLGVSGSFALIASGPFLWRRLVVEPETRWKVAEESVTCLEDTQTKQMRFFHKHKCL